MTGAEIDTLYRLGKEYPHGVEDGDIPSKVGRSELLRKDLAYYRYGTTYLTVSGFELYKQRKALLHS